MKKKLLFGNEARGLMLEGAKKVAEAVGCTIGPNGQNVAIENNNRSITSTKDGVTVAKNVDLENPVENLGAQLIIEAADKTNKVCGDNTSTATVLAYAIAKEGNKAINAGFKPTEVVSGIKEAAKEVIASLESSSKEVTGTDVTNVATIAANNDPEIGKLIAEAIDKVGKDGVITVEESKNMESSVRLVKGLQWDKGYISNYFCNNKERLEVEFEDSYILLTDKSISAVKDLIPIIEEVAKTGKPLTIVCDDMDGEALSTLIVNSIRGTFKCVVVKAPSYGNERKEILTDIAKLTNAFVISDDYGNNLEGVSLPMLGSASVKVTKDSTTITNGKGSQEDVDKRVAELKGQIENTDSEYEKKKLKNRVAKLTSGVAIISVGGITETEMKERKFRVDDTIAATKAAIEKGILPGGGVALLNAAPNTDGKSIGYKVLVEALKAPITMISENSGVNGEVVINNIKDKPAGYGFNAKTGEYCDMVSSGVVDTCKGIVSALRNAASVACVLLTTNCSITIVPDEDKGTMVAQPAGMMPMV